jgi:uncharacterized protein (DUF736 family)
MELANLTLKNGTFSGELRTLTVRAKITIVPNAERTGDKAPDYRIYAGSHEVGAAWKKVSRAGAEFLSVRIDDPALTQPIYAAVVQTKSGEHALIWGR